MFNQLVRPSFENENVHLGMTGYDFAAQISPPHYHDETEILYVNRGALIVSINGSDITVKSGSVMLLSPRIPHSTRFPEGGGGYTMLQFRLENYLGDNINVGKYFSRFIQSASVPYTVFESPELCSVIDKVFLEYEEKKTEYILVIKGLIYNVVALLIREGILPKSNITYSEPILKVLPSISYIEEHYNEKITLEEIASVQRLAPSYFCRLFKKASGTGFVDYLNFVRICKSERMLSHSDKSILEISYELGFSSVSYFNRLFKKYKNCTPSEYRSAQSINR